jgi:coenzyme PQQ synthesis protein D (PqqD)
VTLGLEIFIDFGTIAAPKIMETAKPSLPTRIRVSDHVLFQEIDGECVLLNMSSEQYFGLDDVGTRFWQLLVEEGDPAKVLTQMGSVYDIDEASLRADLAKLLEQLSSEGLVTLEV